MERHLQQAVFAPAPATGGDFGADYSIEQRIT